MILTNQQIYNYANALTGFTIGIKLPVRIGFFLSRNIKTIQQLGQEIYETKINIGKTYGQLNAEGDGYTIPSDNMELVQQELNDLFNLTQEVDIHVFSLSDFDDIELTYEQLNAIIFMIISICRKAPLP